MEKLWAFLIYCNLYSVEKVSVDELSACEDILLKSLSRASSVCPAGHLLTGHQLPARLVPDHDVHLPDLLQTLLNHLTPLLLSMNRPTQIAAYRMLDR